MENQSNKKDNLTKIRNLLNAGCRITVLSVLNHVKTLEARHYLSILRKEGMVIKDNWLEKDGKRFKEWYLEFK